jgi:hypothetical protein
MHQCKYCKKSFARESTLMTHMCEKKRRKMGEHDKANRIAFNIWLKFYKYTSPTSKKQKTYDDFIDNKFYTSFLKFARHCIDLSPYDLDGFADFVFRNAVKIDDWCKNYVYEMYVRENNKKESVDRAAERVILLMQNWSEQTGEVWTDFFDRVNTNQATQWIITGRISPWIIYGSSAGQRLVDRLTEEQIMLVAENIEPKYWQFRLARNKQDTEWIEQTFDKAGI